MRLSSSSVPALQRLTVLAAFAIVCAVACLAPTAAAVPARTAVHQSSSAIAHAKTFRAPGRVTHIAVHWRGYRHARVRVAFSRDGIALAEAAAETEPALAADRDHAHASARTDLLALAAELKQRGVLAADISEQHAADTMYALAADVSPNLCLTRDCGSTDRRSADLIACTLQATLGAR